MELEITGRCRFVDYMKNPLDKKRKRDDQVFGTLPSGTREADLLPAFARERLYGIHRPSKPLDFGVLAACAECWLAYQNKAHLLFPVEEWFDEAVFLSCYCTLRRTLPRKVGLFDQYATMRRKENVTYRAKYFRLYHDLSGGLRRHAHLRRALPEGRPRRAPGHAPVGHCQFKDGERGALRVSARPRPLSGADDAVKK